MRIMKKMIVVLVLALMTSCVRNVNSSTGELVVEYTSVKGDSHGLVTPEERGKIGTVREFKYNGHQYIQFDILSTHGGRSGIVHDPDCPCQSK